jgi:hypothetical protein
MALQGGRPRAVLQRFVAWLRRRGWGQYQAMAASLVGIGTGVYGFRAAAESSGADRVVAAIVAVLCLLGGLVFFAALMVMRDDRPKSSKTRLSAGGGIRWPTSRRRAGHRNDGP